MKRFLKWLGIILGGLIILLIVAYVLIYFNVEQRLNQTYTIPASNITVPTDADAIATGQRIAEIRGCNGCHSSNYGGSVMIDAPIIGRLVAGNLTSGANGIGGTYTTDDWEHAIRHGVGPDGKPLRFMPANEFYQMSDADLGNLIAFLKQVPPVESTFGENVLGPLGRVLTAFGVLPLIPAEKIDHTAPRQVFTPGPTAEYGAYFVTACQGCHGAGFSGGAIPGAPPEPVVPANITPGGVIAQYTPESFIHMMRTGEALDGHQIDNEYMPWQGFSKFTDDELTAILLYLQSLPAKASGNR